MLMPPRVLSGESIETSPVTWPAGKTQVVCSGAGISDADMADPTKSCTITIMLSNDGNNFEAGPKTTWNGGTAGHVAGTFLPPSVPQGYGQSGSPPQAIKVRLDVPGTLSIGVADPAFS